MVRLQSAALNMHVERKQSQPSRIILVIGLGILLFLYQQFLKLEPAVMVTFLMKYHNLSAAEMGAIAAGYYTVYLPVLLIAGIISVILSPRLLIIVGLALAVIGSYLFGQALSATTLAHARGLVGIGSAVLLINVLRLGGVWLPKRHFVLYCALLFALGVLASFGFNRLMGLVQTQAQFHTTLMAANLFGMGLFVIAFFILKTPAVIQTKIKIIALEEMVSIFKNYRLWLTFILFIIGSIFIDSFAKLWGHTFLVQTFKISSIDADILMNVVFLGFAVGMMIMGIIADLFRQRRSIIIVGFLLSACLILMMTYSSQVLLPFLGVLLFLTGLFLGATVICYAFINDLTAPNYSALALSMMLFLLATIVSQTQLLAGWIYYSYSNLNPLLLITAVQLFLGAGLAIFIKQSKMAPVVINTSLFQDLAGAWAGQQKLGRTFWIVYLFGSYLWLMFGKCIAFFITLNPEQQIMVSHLTVLPYIIFALIAVWRCGNNTTWGVIWKFLSRIVVILGVCANVILILTGFLH